VNLPTHPASASPHINVLLSLSSATEGRQIFSFPVKEVQKFLRQKQKERRERKKVVRVKKGKRKTYFNSIMKLI
jgi:hypothetical protein